MSRDQLIQMVKELQARIATADGKQAALPVVVEKEDAVGEGAADSAKLLEQKNTELKKLKKEMLKIQEGAATLQEELDKARAQIAKLQKEMDGVGANLGGKDKSRSGALSNRDNLRTKFCTTLQQVLSDFLKYCHLAITVVRMIQSLN